MALCANRDPRPATQKREMCADPMETSFFTAIHWISEKGRQLKPFALQTIEGLPLPLHNRDLESSCVIYFRTIALWKLHLECVSQLLPIKPRISSEKLDPPDLTGDCGSR